MVAAVTSLMLCPLASTGSGAVVGDLHSAGTGTEARLPTRVIAGAGNLGAQRIRETGIATEGSVRPCPSVRRAVRFYRDRVAYWLDKMGAGSGDMPGLGTRTVRIGTSAPCPRYLAHVWQRKAAALAKRWAFLFDYRSWMTPFWRAIAVCESGSNPPNWDHDSGTYVSTFGIIRGEYDRDAAVFGAPPWHVRHTPRDQYRAALGHQARFGLTGWGCYTHGGYLVHLGRV